MGEQHSFYMETSLRRRSSIWRRISTSLLWPVEKNKPILQLIFLITVSNNWVGDREDSRATSGIVRRASGAHHPSVPKRHALGRFQQHGCACSLCSPLHTSLSSGWLQVVCWPLTSMLNMRVSWLSDLFPLVRLWRMKITCRMGNMDKMGISLMTMYRALGAFMQ